MKKIALATILVATTAIASAQVTVSGKIAEYWDQTTKGGVTTKTVASEATNNITFKAVEDLGQGLQARVVIDTKILANDPKSADSQIGDRESTVGMANKLGSVDLGRSYHTAFNTIRFTDTFGALYGSIASDVHNFRDSGRMSNGTFVKATPMSNVTVSYEASQNTAVGSTDSKAYGAVGSFYGLKTQVARWESNSNSDKTNIVGFNYDLMGYKLAAIRSKDTTSSVLSTGTSYGVAKQMGNTPYTVKASRGTKSDNTGDTLAYNFGVDYAFSNRTTAQVVYRAVNAPASANDIKQIGVGMIHKF